MGACRCLQRAVFAVLHGGTGQRVAGSVYNQVSTSIHTLVTYVKLSQMYVSLSG